VQLTSPSRRAAGLLAAGALGLGTVVASGGVAQAAPADFSGTVTATPGAGVNTAITVPAHYCQVAWTLIGGQGGGDGTDAGGLAGELRLTTSVTPGDTFLLQPGQQGADAGPTAPGGRSGTRSSGRAGDAGDGAGGGASTVRSGTSTSAREYLHACDGDGAGPSGGQGGGAGANESAVPWSSSADYVDGPTEETGNGSIGYEGILCDAPNAPSDLEAEAGDGEATLTFWPGGQDYGMDPVTGYQVSADGGDTWSSLHAPVDTSGNQVHATFALANGDSYDIAVRATSAVGPSEASNVVTGVAPYHAVAAPTGLTAKVGPSTILVSWQAPAGESGITGYAAWAIPGDTPQSSAGMVLCSAGPDARSCLLGVAPGQPYTVGVHALNPGGGDPTFVVSDVVPAPAAPQSVPAASAPLPTGQGTALSVGQQVTLTGSGYLPGSTVTLVVYSTPTVLGTAVADANGSFTAQVTLPATLAGSHHSLVAAGVDGDGNPRNLRTDVTVAGAAAASSAAVAPASAGSLAYTGFSVAGPLVGALAALLLGAVLLLVSRRRAG